MTAPIPASTSPPYDPDDEEQLSKFAADQIVAYYIHNYRNRHHWERQANADDDYYKAQYLNSLLAYFLQKATRRIPIKDGDQNLDEIINMVYNIFDRAYFHKQNHPSCSDLECFAEAERYYCKEKALDYSPN